MDDHTVAPAKDSEPSTATQDHTAQDETETSQDERLNHLAHQLDQSHLHCSYWKFQSIDDDRRAAAHGFTTPEELLVLANNSDERHDDIKIVWMGATGDPGSRSAVVGTASQHLQTIYELRNLLGLPMSLQGQVPIYPTSTDVCLKQYWEKNYGEQSSARTVQAHQAAGQQELSPATLDPGLVNQSCLAPATVPPQVAFGLMVGETYSTERTQLMLPPLSKPASLQGCSSDTEMLAKQVVPAGQLPESLVPPQNYDEIAQRQESFSTTATFSATTFCATDTWSHSDLVNMAKLPCIDCGDDDGHTNDCHIGNLNFNENLTMLDYRILADIVEQFDPGPWTTHFDPYPEREPEDPQVQIAGIAEVIRNEDSYKDDSELHGLPDEYMIILWAFKTSDNVEVIDW
ncbi:hypothetical protein J3E72DRAFT_374549 [Bipolaris maydis]|nr:hypothetical protein J3E72DRAFT_374549 [Bipolaris maydis]